jgi:hypothetical protein
MISVLSLSVSSTPVKNVVPLLSLILTVLSLTPTVFRPKITARHGHTYQRLVHMC